MKTQVKQLITALVLVAALAGCGEPAERPYNPEKIPLNVISAAKLTNRERLLMSGGNNKSFVFDYHADASFSDLKIWVERYEFGVLAADKTLNMSSALRNDGNEGKPIRGTIMFELAELSSEDGKPSGKAIMRMTTGSGYGYASINIPPIEIPSDGAAMSGASIHPDTPIDGTLTLAQISYSTKENATMPFATDSVKNLEYIKDFDVTFLLKCEFTKKA